MTTLDPGASVVFTQGLVVRPFSTAFLASSAAPIITDGFEVFVHDVIAAIATAPWSSLNSVPSESFTFAGLDGRPWPLPAGWLRQSCGAPSPLPPSEWDGASLDGKDSSEASSTLECSTSSGFSWAGTPSLSDPPSGSPSST